MPSTNDRIITEFGECLESLEEAVIKAGGSPKIALMSFLNSISGFELLMQIAPNKIRFHYEPSKESWEKPVKEAE